jgi:hypothetical protein
MKLNLRLMMDDVLDETDPEVNPEPCGRYQPCTLCGEPILSMDGLNWTHEDGDVYCGTGDGMAYPYEER